MEAMYAHVKSFEEAQNLFYSYMSFGESQPNAQYIAVVGYKNYLRKIEAENKKKPRKERIYDTAIYAFLGAQPYLNRLKEKAGYIEESESDNMSMDDVDASDTIEPNGSKIIIDLEKLNNIEREVYKEMQLLLWERIEKFVVSQFPKEVMKSRFEYEVLYQTMYVDFVEKMIFRYKPYSPDRKSLVRPTTYFMEHIFKNALTTYQSDRTEMTKHDIDKMTKIQKAINSMVANNIKPTPEKISGITDLSIGVVRNALVTLDIRRTVSLDAKVKDDDGNENENVRIPKSKMPTPEEEVIRRDTDRILAELINTELTEIERKVFFMRDDIWDERDIKHMPYKDIAEELGITEKDAKRIHNAARKKLSRSRRLGIALNHVRPSLNKKDSRKIENIMISQMKSAIEDPSFPAGKISDWKIEDEVNDEETDDM